jgi:hypothetical protein
MIFRSWCRRKNTVNGRDNDSAQALVETALVLPVLAILLIGATEFALVAYAAIEVSNAAKAGVQYGAQNGATASDTSGIATAASNDAVNVTGLTTTSSYSCICSDGSASTCQPTDCPNSHIEEILTVKTQTSYHPPIVLPGFYGPYTLKGQAIQKCGQ